MIPGASTGFQGWGQWRRVTKLFGGGLSHWVPTNVRGFAGVTPKKIFKLYLLKCAFWCILSELGYTFSFKKLQNQQVFLKICMHFMLWFGIFTSIINTQYKGHCANYISTFLITIIFLMNKENTAKIILSVSVFVPCVWLFTTFSVTLNNSAITPGLKEDRKLALSQF